MARGGAGAQSRVRNVFRLLLVAAGEESENNVVATGLLDMRGRLTEERPKWGDARGDKNDQHFSNSPNHERGDPVWKAISSHFLPISFDAGVLLTCCVLSSSQSAELAGLHQTAHRREDAQSHEKTEHKLES